MPSSHPNHDESFVDRASESLSHLSFGALLISLGWAGSRGMFLLWNHGPSVDDLADVARLAVDGAWSGLFFLVPLIIYFFIGLVLFQIALQVCPSLKYVCEESVKQQEGVDEDEGDEEDDGIWECRLCYCHATVRAAFTGCGHVICEECSTKISRSQCPYCKFKSKTVRLYE